jgi:hypothetical protein
MVKRQQDTGGKTAGATSSIFSLKDEPGIGREAIRC